MIDAILSAIHAPDWVDAAFPMLLEAGIKGAVILATGLVMVLCARSASAGFRHALLSLAVLASLIIPAVSLVTPQYRLPFAFRFALDSPSSTEGVLKTSVNVRPAPKQLAAGLARPDTEALDEGSLPIEEAARADEPRSKDEYLALELEADSPRLWAGLTDTPLRHRQLSAPPIDVESRTRTDLQPLPGDSGSSVAPSLLNRVEQCLSGAIKWCAEHTSMVAIGIWVVGMVLVLLRSLVGLCCAAWLAARAWPVHIDERVATLAVRSRRRLNLNRSTRVFLSNRISTPMTWGFVRPTVLLPIEALQWTDERIRLVFLHEFAHIKRSDWLIQMLARTACAVYWFNPLMWYAMRRLSIEREQACDDDVLAMGTRPSDYARHLLDIARALRARTAAPNATLAMARRSELEGRLMSILNWTRHRTERRGMMLFLPATVSIIGLSTALAAVSFVATPQDDRQETVVVSKTAGSAEESTVKLTDKQSTADQDHAASNENRDITITSAGTGGGVVVQGSDGATLHADEIVLQAHATGARAGSGSGVEVVTVGGGSGGQAHTHTGGFHGSVSTAPDGSKEFRLDVPHEVDGNYNLTLVDQDATLRLEVRGKVGFDTKKGAVREMGPGSTVKVRVEYKNGRTEELYTIADVDGEQHQTWKVNGEVAPFDPQKSNWRNDTIRHIFEQLASESKERQASHHESDARVNRHLIELHQQLEAIQGEIEPQVESEVEAIHAKLEPMLQKIRDIHVELAPIEVELAPLIENVQRRATAIAERTATSTKQLQKVIELEAPAIAEEFEQAKITDATRQMQAELAPLIQQLAEEASSGNLDAARIEALTNRIEEMAARIEAQVNEFESKRLEFEQQDLERLHAHLREIAPDQIVIESQLEELEPMIEKITKQAEAHGHRIEKQVQEQILPMQLEIEQMGREIETRIQPMVERIEAVVKAMKAELAGEVSHVLQNELIEAGFAESHPATQCAEAVAKALMKDCSININDDELRISESRTSLAAELKSAFHKVFEVEEIELKEQERAQLKVAIEAGASRLADLRFALSDNDVDQ